MMKKICLFGSLLLAALCCGCAGNIRPADEASAGQSDPVNEASAEQPVSVDAALKRTWEQAGLSDVQEAPDSVLVRRVYLDLAGRLPTPEEAKLFIESKGTGKYEFLVDTVLKDPGFVSLWSMRFGDTLRVKSEFPINLWPNAVYVYMRRIREFLGKDESYADFVRALLLSSGSNFRDPCSNFYRAHADRSPRGIANGTMLTLFGVPLDSLPEDNQKEWTNIFEEIAFKSTKEWKEEIVYVKSMPERKIFLPTSGPYFIQSGTMPGIIFSFPGVERTVPAGAEARLVLADHVTAGDGRRVLARALVNRTWQWFFGEQLCQDSGGRFADVLELLTDDFMKHNFNFRHLCRTIVLSAAYRSASIQPDAGAKQPYFAAYPVRRLEAEVLDDVIRDLTGVPSRYSSVIPEPFTFLPKDMRTVEIADGSISSSFLILFGRPSRDTGDPKERSNEITAKQRLFLFNSADLYRRLMQIPRRPDIQNLSLSKKINFCYLLFYSRLPTEAEKKILLDRFHAMPPKSRWKLINDLLWTLANSGEFLYRH